MKKEMAAKYDFKIVEEGRYEWWIKNQFFKAGLKPEAKPFTIVIPPPNVTGKLHLGHAWDNTLQDIIIRRKRMQGYDTLYLPGTDHAGLATQAKVDQRLKQQGLSRYDLGREKYLEQAFEWKEEYAHLIHQQWAALGISVDYSKERFTLENDLNKAVNKVFIELYNKGLIYRGNRIINWDSEAKTALSNIEVEYKETHGKLYYFKYPFVDGSGHLVVATTRPETMFADQAVMINPNDKRYLKYLDKQVLIPGTNVTIPIIIDDYVDMEFGTGVVKVTPAHDPNDFEVAKRHNLLMPLCMNEDGSMNQMAFEFAGLDRFECRKQLIKKLTKLNLVEKIDDYTNSVGYSERTGVVVEPRLSLQWFVKMEPLAQKVISNSKVEFVPERFKKIFDHWMNNIQDWTVSRQIWWGHRIPAWYYQDQVKVQVESPGQGWVQDNDVLDTWFSSALWPFSTLGWPNTNNPDFKRYYPTDVLVTGYDIIFFWVARMIFSGLEFTGIDPFKTTLLHGLIRDKDGAKMSKSLGNGVDPIDVINQHGVDALRYFLVTNSAPGQDLRYDETKVEASWNFINKLWNISRFVLMNLDSLEDGYNTKQLNLFDKWILTRLATVIKEADYYFEKYEFVEASKILYHFIWDEFASWYLELAKLSLQDSNTKANTQKVLLFVLKNILKLLHPIMPFVTEQLFLEISNETTITLSAWPDLVFDNQESVTQFNIISDLIVKIRNLRSEYQIAPSKQLVVHLVSQEIELLEINRKYLEKFLNTSELLILTKIPTNDVVLVAGKVDLYVNKEDLIDRVAEKEGLLKQLTTLKAELERSERLLKNSNFIAKAPAQKLELEKQKYQNYLNQYQAVEEKLKNV